MTNRNAFDPMADPLPGLGEPELHTSDLERAVRRTIAAVDAAGLLTERDAAACQLAIELSRIVDLGQRSRRSTGASMAARELRDTLAMLPEAEATATDEWAEFARQLRQVDHADQD